MEWLTVTWAIYRKAFTRAAELTLKNWPVAGSVFVYAVVMSASAIVAGALGILGGLVMGVVWAGCIGSFLYLVEMMVRTSKVTFDDLKRSFAAYVWDVMGVMFILWLFAQLVAPALLSLPQGTVVVLCVNLAMFVLLNAVPELIYLGHYSSVALLQESYTFIADNWIEWFPANIAAGLVVYGAAQLELDGALSWVQTAVMTLLIYFVMVMRGLLFSELHGSSRRGRAFKHRMGG